MATLKAMYNAVTSPIGTAVRNYWNQPPKDVRENIEGCLAFLEGVPNGERSRKSPIILTDGTQSDYGSVIDNLRLLMCRIAFRGYDLSAYKQRVAALRSYSTEN